MSPRDEGRMGVDPLRQMKAESYADAIIDRKQDVLAEEVRSEEEGETAKRRWIPRPKNPDDPNDRTRHSYYVGDWVHSRLKALAREYDVPVSDLARYLLKEGINRLENGDMELEALEMVVRKLP